MTAAGRTTTSGFLIEWRVGFAPGNRPHGLHGIPTLTHTLVRNFAREAPTFSYVNKSQPKPGVLSPALARAGTSIGRIHRHIHLLHTSHTSSGDVSFFVFLNLYFGWVLYSKRMRLFWQGNPAWNSHFDETLRAARRYPHLPKLHLAAQAPLVHKRGNITYWSYTSIS